MIELIFWACVLWAFLGVAGMFCIDIINKPGWLSPWKDYGMAALHGLFMWSFVFIRMFK